MSDRTKNGASKNRTSRLGPSLSRAARGFRIATQAEVDDEWENGESRARSAAALWDARNGAVDGDPY